MAEQATALAVDVTHSFRAMASTVNLRVVDPLGDVSDRFAAVQDLFSAIERACTRFNDSSDLMRANAEPGA